MGFAAALLVLFVPASYASEADLPRLQQQRAQQQMELQLKMQQQQERATRSPPDAAADIQRRQFEVEQQQRLQRFNDTQSREAALQQRRDLATDAASTDQARRLQTAPKLNTDRSIAGAR
jgi:hypothetical protein